MQTYTEDELTGIIRDALIYTTRYNGETVSVVHGIVVEDFKGRFPQGGWITTSIITEGECGDEYIKTLNSVYKIESWHEVKGNDNG